MRPDRSFSTLLPLCAGFFLAVLAASVAVVLSFEERGAQQAARSAMQFEYQLNQIQTMVTNAETGQRGYLLTGSSGYLEPYETARHDLPPQLDVLASETSGDPQQERSIASLRSLVDRKLEELQRTVELRSSGRADDALAMVNTGSGRRLMEAIRGVLAELRAEQTRIAETRIAQVARLDGIGRAALVGCVLVVVAFGLLALRDARSRILLLQSAVRQLERETTEREAAEKQVRQMQRIEAVGQLTGGIAHDFNNMLAIVTGSLDVARRRLAASQAQAALKFIDNAAEGANRAAFLTARLLAFSRQQALEPSVLDANRLVADMSEMLRRILGETIEIEAVLAGSLWRTFADPTQLESALVNLAVNARDAMPGGGKLTIETANTDLDERYAGANPGATAGQHVMISVTDAGVGMAPEVMERAFDPFYTTKGAGKGSGLGLSQVFGFVKQSAGHVKVYSELGRGTTVKIYLPRYVGASAPGEEVPRAETLPRGAADTTILVVEDDDAVRDMTVAALRELGYTVIHAPSPSEALQRIGTHARISLLLTDVVLPEMNGRQLAEIAQERIPGLKVLFTTGYTRNAIVHNGLLDSGVALLAKPFTLSQLATKVDQALR